MSFLESVVKEGVERGLHEGFEDYLKTLCKGPKEACPMPEGAGCACQSSDWRKLPWYKQLFRIQPKKTCRDTVLKIAIRLKVDRVLESKLSRGMKPVFRQAVEKRMTNDQTAS